MSFTICVIIFLIRRKIRRDVKDLWGENVKETRKYTLKYLIIGLFIFLVSLIPLILYTSKLDIEDTKWGYVTILFTLVYYITVIYKYDDYSSIKMRAYDEKGKNLFQGKESKFPMPTI